MKIKFLFFILFVLVLKASAQIVRPDAKNPHYLNYKGKPIVAISSADHYGSVINQEYDFETYLKTLQKDNLNYVRLMLGSYFEMPGAFGIAKNVLAPSHQNLILPWQRSSEPGNLAGGNKLDLDMWNEAYFVRLKKFVSEAEKLGIIVEVTLFSSYYGSWTNSPFYFKNNINKLDSVGGFDAQTLRNGNIFSYQEKMVKKIVSELNAFDNIFYEIQNEPWADHAVTSDTISEYIADAKTKNPGDMWRNIVDLADTSSLDWQKQIALTIVNEEKKLPKKHIISQNYCNYRYPLTETEANISIIQFHYGYPEAVDQNYWQNKVVGINETGFAGNTDEVYRKQAWNFILAGGGIFNGLDYSFVVGFENGTAKNNAPGGGSVAFRSQLKVLSGFINSFKFTAMKPDKTSIAGSPACFSKCLSEIGKQYAIYIEGLGNNKLLLNLPKANYQFDWINPLDGKPVKSENMKHTGGILKMMTPDFKGEIALSIKASN